MKNKKSLGQHWLKDRPTLENIAALARPTKPSTCLEIGPGLGTLTSSLFKHFNEIIAVEYDETLANNLPKSFPGKDLKVIHADILDFDLSKLPTDYVAVGNIPYYITSLIIMKLLTSKNRPSRIVLLVQKEVAERIAATAGRHTIISLSTQNYASVQLGSIVKKNLFTPPPKVDSQIIILTPHHPITSEKVIQFIKRGFSSPRKKLYRNLMATGYPRVKIEQVFEKQGISIDSRPADLSLDTWEKLFENLS
jgi:16S rRNA (adenine1518-N6/adenine1519-N6)-dimethyltransferase